MQEEWRSVKNFEGRYEISNLGRVKSLTRGRWKERIMVQHDHREGYLVIWLRQPSIHKKYFVHRLVAEAFIPNPDNSPVVN